MAYILLNSIATGYKSHYRPDRGFYSNILYSLKVHTSKALRSLRGIISIYSPNFLHLKMYYLMSNLDFANLRSINNDFDRACKLLDSTDWNSLFSSGDDVGLIGKRHISGSHAVLYASVYNVVSY